MAGTRIAGFKGYILEVSSHVGGPSLPAHPAGIEQYLGKILCPFYSWKWYLDILLCVSLILGELKTQVTAVRKEVYLQEMQDTPKDLLLKWKAQQIIKAKHCKITKVTEFIVGMFRTKTQQFTGLSFLGACGQTSDSSTAKVRDRVVHIK